ncbi:MAG: hypothetical protein F6K47_38195 [Symploca sp. SIO2E6]|nr:hypothetical protein [Symploca sp. SIO2E6]
MSCLLLTVILLAVGFVGLLSICFYVFFKQNKIDGSGDSIWEHLTFVNRRSG